MKKLLLLIALIIGSVIQAQDLATIKVMANATSLDEIKAVSDKIALSAGDKFVYYKTGNRSLRDEKYKTVIYAPASMTDEEKKEFSQEEKEKCLIVVWIDTGTGYTFFEVDNQEKNLKPFWNSIFTTAENEFRVDKSLKYKYIKNEHSVSIVKSY